MPISLGTTTVTALYLGTTSISSAYLGNTQVFGGSFTPLSLFSGGAQGIWLDPSDLSTMFSDRAGTTPVTAPGTVVGLRLDKSKGLTPGAELVTNGDFASGSTGYVEVLGGTISYASQTMLATATTGNTGTYRDVTVVANKSYQVAWRQVSGTNIRMNVYDGAGFGTTLFTNGTGDTIVGNRVTVLRPSSTTLRIYAHTPTGSTAEFDNISVRELQGNHATAPTDAARPIYGVEPKGGRRNLLLATDTLATQSLTVTAVAHTLAFTGTGTVTLSGASTAGPLVGTGAGNRVSLTFTPTAASLTLTVSGSVTLGQLERASSATAYQKVVTAYDITESGVPTCHYVQYDGSDDSMSTAAIDFTGTDKMSVFAGIRKLSDAAGHIVGGNGNNPGQFEILSSGWVSNPSRYGGAFYSGALLQIDSPANFAPPRNDVLSWSIDLAGATNPDRAKLRVNAASQTLSLAGSPSAGNFSNQSIFIGRRDNASLSFNGRDYGILVVGKAATPTEITDTEAWLAAKTSGVTL